MIEETLIAGFGGQGVLLSGKLLAHAALAAGFETTWFPSYGPEMRGGTANCTVIFGDEEIGSPIASAYDTIIVMNQPSLERFECKVRSSGRLLVNASMVPTEATRTDIDVYRLGAVEIAEELGDARAANVVMLGAYAALIGNLPFDDLERVIAETFASKGSDVVQRNLAALRAGSAAMQPSSV